MSDVIYNISSGFFDSVNGDRLYSAADMNKPYKRVIADGIFPTPQGTPSTDFQVVAVSGMSVAVLAGNAMIGSRWAENTDDVGITIAGNSSSSPRIDSIFLHIDTGMDTRAAGVVYRQGTAAGTPTAPAMVQTDNITELRLADILVAPSAAIITQANITDQRGGSDCPWVAGLIQQVDTSALFEQYRAAYAAQQQDQADEWNTFMDHLARDYDISMSLRKHESTYTSTAAASLIPINIDGYDTTKDLLQVYINGIFAVEGTHYIVKSAAQIQLTNAISAGQKVHFVIYKAVMGGAQPIIPTDEQVQDAVDAYMDAHPGALVVDPELSDTSTHAIQNKAVTEAIENVNGRLQQVNYAVINNDLLRAATWNQGFVKSNGTLTPATSSATYNYSGMIPVEEGERYKYALDASSGTLIIAAYVNADDESAVTAKSVRGTDGMASGTYVVPNGVNYIRITLRVSDYASQYFYKRTSLTEMGTRMTAVENNMTGLSADVEELKERQAGFVYNNNIRRACVCFQFDDATSPTNPNAIKALFTERGYHVGWVLPTHDNTNTPISEEVITRHLGYQADGDEIICHGKNHTIDWTDTTQTDAQIDTYLKESKATLESYGFIINGFVPTMSAMAAKFRYLMRRYYQYGYSVYIGAYNGTQRSFSYPTDGVYNLWRVAMDSTTLENTKAALDAAIEAGGCITFYGHPLYYNNASYKLTTENITGLLDYVKAKEQAGEIVVDVPGKTVRNFFDVRNDDVVQDWIPVSISNIDLHENMESPMIWAVYYSRKFNLLSLDCRLRPTLNITGDAVLFKLPVKVGLNNIMVTEELGLPIKVVNATVGSEVRLVGESATWARSTMNRLHLVCMLSMAAAQMW